MNIPDILKQLELLDENRIRRGALKAKSEQITSATEVLEHLASFNGTGWYCGTDNPEIRILPSDPLPTENESFPIAAEIVNGEQSLHLARSETGWEITILTRTESNGNDSFLVRNRLLARNNAGFLHYEVLWTPQKIDEQTELRPQLFRFLGFNP